MRANWLSAAASAGHRPPTWPGPPPSWVAVPGASVYGAESRVELGLCPRGAQGHRPRNACTAVWPDSCCLNPGAGGLPTHGPRNAGPRPQASASRPEWAWPCQGSEAGPLGMSPHCHLVVAARALGSSGHLGHVWLLQAQVWSRQGFLTPALAQMLPSPPASPAWGHCHPEAVGKNSGASGAHGLGPPRPATRRGPTKERPHPSGHSPEDSLPMSSCSLPSGRCTGFSPSGV